jgi:hypothetical protein
MLTQAWDAKVATDEVKATTMKKVRELLLAHENVGVVGRRTDALLSERSAELQELRLVVGTVCAHLSPLPSTKVPLIDRLWELPNHVERAIAEGICPGGGVALGRMVSHFYEVDTAIIVMGYTAD